MLRNGKIDSRFYKEKSLHFVFAQIPHAMSERPHEKMKHLIVCKNFNVLCRKKTQKLCFKGFELFDKIEWSYSNK